MSRIFMPVLALFGAMLACGSEHGPIVPVRLEGFPRLSSGLTSGAREAIRDQARWASIWSDLVSREYPARPAPSIDFGRNMVLLAALGERPTGGYSISIDHVAFNDADRSLVVDTRSMSPGRSCVVTLAVTQPVDAVVVPRLNCSIQFMEEKLIHDCPP